MNREQLRQRMLRKSKRNLEEIRQYLRDLDWWNENRATEFGAEGYIDGNRAQMLRIAEHYELTIELLESGADYIPPFHL